MKDPVSTHGRQAGSTNDRQAWSPFQLRFGHGPILVHMNLHHSQEQPYDVCIRIIPLTQTLHLEHHTE